MVASMRVTGLVRGSRSREAVLCGLCTAGIILTTIVGYGLVGVSILLMALLQRGGVLSMAPILPRSRPRDHDRPQSRLALFLTLTAVLCAVFGGPRSRSRRPVSRSWPLYLCCYAVRLPPVRRVQGTALDARRLLVSGPGPGCDPGRGRNKTCTRS